jgi:hypothetical protein
MLWGRIHLPWPRTEYQAEFVAVVATLQKAIRGWCDLPVNVVNLESDADKNHRGIHFSIPVSVLQQSSGNSACTCTRAFLHSCQNVTCYTPLFTFCTVRGKEPVSLINLCRVQNL